MRRITQPSHVAAFVAFFAAVMAVGLVLKDSVTHASVQQLGAALQRGPEYDAATARHTRLGRMRLPDWSARGWRLIGGRTDLFEDNRDAITGYYQRGKANLAYTVLEGADPLSDEAGPRGVMLTRQVGGTTAVFVGWPLDDQLRAELEILAETPRN